MPEIVIAVRAQWLTHDGIINGMTRVAVQRVSVSAVLCRDAWCACVAGGSGSVVHGPVAGCGERGEHLRTIGNLSRYVVVTAGGAGVYQLPGVAGIQICTRRADGGATVAFAASTPHVGARPCRR
ncbi:hypothetical protein IWGMT90018_40710 [Mycobacterium kiyosense]|nr:hypothetical protein IWGMT90018_40710 [Mycobacterium kiyosense]